MKHIGKWILSIFSKALVIIIIIVFFLYGKPFVRLLSDVNGEISVQQAVLKQKMESTRRLEAASVDEEGTLNTKTSVIIIGTVGTTVIRYRYTASIGIDLSKVIMTADADRIIFYLPEPEVLNDGIEALQVIRNDFFSKAIDKSVEVLLNEQRQTCREKYLKEENQADMIWEKIINAFNETICIWLENYGERHYQFEFIKQDGTAAETTAALLMDIKG